MPNMSLVPMESASLRGTGKHPNITYKRRDTDSIGTSQTYP